jgi:hypothetical protein
MALIAPENAACMGRPSGGELGALPLQPLVDFASPLFLGLLDCLVDLALCRADRTLPELHAHALDLFDYFVPVRASRVLGAAPEICFA